MGYRRIPSSDSEWRIMRHIRMTKARKIKPLSESMFDEANRYFREAEEVRNRLDTLRAIDGISRYAQEQHVMPVTGDDGREYYVVQSPRHSSDRADNFRYYLGDYGRSEVRDDSGPAERLSETRLQYPRWSDVSIRRDASLEDIFRVDYSCNTTSSESCPCEEQQGDH